MRPPRMFNRRRPWLAMVLLAALMLGTGCVRELAPVAHPAAAAIAAAHPLATRAGFEVLDAGGNAFDAAVAVSAALAVVEPMGSGIGGGGFWLLHRAADGHQVMVDGRERAPLAATRDMYLDDQGEVIPKRSVVGPLAAAIPGVPAALAHIATKFGRLPLATSLAPAIRYARDGFPVTEQYRALAERRLDVLLASPAATDAFLDRGFVPALDYLIKQADLATTLEAIAVQGHDGFYGGPVAQRLVEGVRAAGGIWSLDDLAQYRIAERQPITGQYRGMRITSAAPPSSGGIVLLQMLGMLEGRALARMQQDERIHHIVEAMRRAYRDRAIYLGDSDFVSIDTPRLLSRKYLQDLRADITDAATPSAALTTRSRPRGTDTTHFSVIDRDGNRVAATLSINYPFGSGFMPPGTGVVLNNEMDDFAAKPGVGNLYGLIGGEANAIAPGKRPLSSMSPTFFETDDRVLIVGTPGGSRIITMVLLAGLEFAHRRGTVADWVALPRFHHQYVPDKLVYEPEAFSDTVRKALTDRGHKLHRKDYGYGSRRGYGNMQAILWDKRNGKITAASDPRGEGLALVR